jgi:flagellar basal-body rod protein FlgF
LAWGVLLLVPNMISGIYQSAAGMLSQMENHQVIAENLASSSVAGHRRSITSFESFLKPMMDVNQSGTPGQGAASIPFTRPMIDFSQGQIQPDGVPTHVAISGTGFFAVELPDGRGTAYTRNGSFHLNPQGELVTMDGWRVMGAGGATLIVPKPAEPILIGDGGDISQGEGTIGKFQVSEFEDPSSQLDWIGGTYFISKGGAPTESTTATSLVKQGAVETSNVNPVHEMVSLIQATRTYEANSMMLKTQDNTLDQIIRQVGSR